jgi:hypothetical protein
MTRAFAIALFAALMYFAPVHSEARSAMKPESFETRIQTLLEWARENGRGVSVHFDGQVLHGVVRDLLADAVVLSNQERGEIIVRREAITAVAGK